MAPSSTSPGKRPLATKDSGAPRQTYVNDVNDALPAVKKRRAEQDETDRPAKRVVKETGPNSITPPPSMVPGIIPPGHTDAKTALKAKDGPIYFWKKTDEHVGWLSQWYEYPMEDPNSPGVVFQTAEHYMMYRKALVFNDAKAAEAIVARKNGKAVSSAQARKLGRKVKGFDGNVWNDEKRAIVEEGTYLKMTRPCHDNSLVLRQLLLDTGDRDLVEASPFDRVWGIGFGAGNAEANRDKWGLNLLGKSLMTVRHRLRIEDKEEALKKGK